MVHGVSFKDEKTFPKMTLTANQFKTHKILTNRTGKKEAFFEELFSNGKDNYLIQRNVKNGLLLVGN
jgi:hypothetical protein